MVMTSDETQIQILANWPMSHAKCVTRDSRKNSEYRVVAAIRKSPEERDISKLLAGAGNRANHAYMN